MSSSEYILDLDPDGSGTVASKSFRAGRPARSVLIMIEGMLGIISCDSFKIESIGPIASRISSGGMFARLFPTPGTAGSLLASKLAPMFKFCWPWAGGIILFFPAALVMMPPVDVRLAAGVGTLELLVLMPDIAWLVCRVIFGRQK